MEWRDHYFNLDSCDVKGRMALRGDQGSVLQESEIKMGPSAQTVWEAIINVMLLIWEIRNPGLRVNKWYTYSGTVSSRDKTRFLNFSLVFQCSFYHKVQEMMFRSLLTSFTAGDPTSGPGTRTGLGLLGIGRTAGGELECNVLESSQSQPHPGLWKNCLPRNWSLVPKMLRTAELQYPHRLGFRGLVN